MYALVTLWQLSAADADRPLPLLVPFVCQSPGFVQGYWTYEPATGKAIGFTLLEDAGQAYDLKNAIESLMDREEHAHALLELVRVQELVLQVPPHNVPAIQAGELSHRP